MAKQQWETSGELTLSQADLPSASQWAQAGDEGKVWDIVCPDVNDDGPVADPALTSQEHGRCMKCVVVLV